VFDFRFNFSHRNSVWTVFNFSQVGSDLIDVVAGVPVADALFVSALLRRDKPCHTSASVTVVMKRWAGSWAYNQSSNPELGRGFLVSLTAFVSSTKFTAGLV
jgi:hypothetical protein